MEIFEYALARLDSESVGNGSEHRLRFSVVGNQIQSDGSIQKIELAKSEIVKDLFFGYRQVSKYDFDSTISANTLTDVFMPYLSSLGLKGWEVIEYKFATKDVFAQALLKRRVKTKE